MIIICKECSTKFRLDESLLKETGSKVRCTVCKHIFSAYPPQALGKPEVSQSLPSQQGYFDSEENVGAGAQQQSEPEPDDDGLELDVDEDDDDLDDGLDLGDDDSTFDDGGIAMGASAPGMDSGMNFDEDMETDGLPGMNFDSDSDVGLGDMDLDTEINLNLDQGEDIELDAASDLKMDTVPPVQKPAQEPETAEEESLGDDDVDDFEFEFELDEEEKIEIEEDLTLDEPSLDTADIEDIEGGGLEEDFELSLDDDNFSAELESPDDSPDKIGELEYEEDFDELDDSIGLELDDDVIGEDDDDDNYEIEEVDAFDDDDDDYEIEEYEDDDKEFEDDDIIDDEFEDEDRDFDEATPAKPKKKSGKLLKFLVAILLILCVGYGAFMVTGGFTKSIDFSKINFSIVKNLLNFSKMDQIPVWATINNQSLNGRYVNNETAGKLFVITGKITNESSIPLNYIQVEGTLIAKGGVIAKKKRVYCGNKIPEGQLSSLSVGAISRILQRKGGEQGANIDIKTNEAIPFMLVFSGLPEELENYTVTVTSFDRMKTK